MLFTIITGNTIDPIKIIINVYIHCWFARTSTIASSWYNTNKVRLSIFDRFLLFYSLKNSIFAQKYMKMQSKELARMRNPASDTGQWAAWISGARIMSTRRMFCIWFFVICLKINKNRNLYFGFLPVFQRIFLFSIRHSILAFHILHILDNILYQIYSNCILSYIQGKLCGLQRNPCCSINLARLWNGFTESALGHER